jgi:hypothetical protein
MASSKKAGNVPVRSASSAPGYNAEEAIRKRAYEIYEERGKADGNAEGDWLRAEAEILKQRAGKTSVASR